MKVYREAIDEIDSYEAFIGQIFEVENLYHLCHGGVSILDLQFKEFIIECDNCPLFLYNDSQIRTKPWVPIDTEIRTRNMAERDIAFMSLEPDMEKCKRI